MGVPTSAVYDTELSAVERIVRVGVCVGCVATSADEMSSSVAFVPILPEFTPEIENVTMEVPSTSLFLSFVQDNMKRRAVAAQKAATTLCVIMCL